MSGVSFWPIAKTFSGTQEAIIANNTKRFGNGRATFSTSTRYQPNATFAGAPRQNLWWSAANKAAAAAAAKQSRRRKSRKSRKSRKTRRSRRV